MFEETIHHAQEHGDDIKDVHIDAAEIDTHVKVILNIAVFTNMLTVFILFSQ